MNSCCCLGRLQSKRSGKIRKCPMCSPNCYRSTCTYNSFQKSLYFETGWQPLSDGRKLSKLTIMHKIHNSCVPKYLSEIIPNTRGNDSAYRTRNSENYTLPKCRLYAFKKSFIPDTIHLWYSVSLDIRRKTSVNKFKTLLSGLYQTCISKPPSY